MRETFVQAQFGQNAANYVSSAAHSSGASLDQLREWMLARRPRRALDIATGGGHTALAITSACTQLLATDCTFPMLLAAHHFASPAQFVSESVRCLRPSGCLAVIDNVVPENPAAAALINAFEKLRDSGHGRHQTPADWQKLFAANGLAVVCNLPYRKPLNFADYCTRMSVPAHTRAQLSAVLLQAPAQVHSYFNPRHIDGALWFDLHEILIIGTLAG